MLQRTIQTYNFILDIVEKLSLKGRAKAWRAAAVLGVLMLTGSLVAFQLAAANGSKADEQAKQQLSDDSSSPETPQSGAGNQHSSESKLDDNKSSDGSSASKPSKPDSSSKPGGQTSTGASGGGTSTASSFETKIMGPGQVAAGTMIAYNASKDLKSYYGGDLQMGTEVTISKSGATPSSDSVTVTVPDNQDVGLPGAASYDPSPYFSVNTSASSPASGNAFMLAVSAKPGTPAGSYVFHVATTRTANSPDTWWYHGFITINVVD